MGVQATGDPSMGVQVMGVQPVRLVRSSIQAWLKDGLIQTMGAGASAKIFAIRHRCYCHCCERAPIPNSNCLAFPDVRQNCSVDPWVAIQSSAVV